MNKLFTLVALVLGLFSASVSATPIRIYFVFTQDGADYAAASFKETPAQVVADEIIGLNAVYSNSGTNASFESAGWSVNTCCGTATTVQDQLQWATNSFSVQTLRDDANADMVVVISNPITYNQAGVPSDSAAGIAYYCGSAATAIAAVHVTGLSSLTLAHEVGHVLCSTHAKGVNLKTGSNPDDCLTVWTVMAYLGDQMFESYLYTDYEGNIGYANGSPGTIHGSGVSPSAANQAMASSCSAANSGRWTYSCVAQGNCVTSGGWITNGGNCTHSRTQSNTFTGYTSTVSGIADSVPPPVDQHTQFQCPRKYRIALMEGPNVKYNGTTTLGDSQHDNVSAINAQAPITATFRNTKNAPNTQTPHY